MLVSVPSHLGNREPFRNTITRRSLDEGKSRSDQLDILCRFFPQLGDKKVFSGEVNHPKSDLCTLSPNWKLIAGTYSEAVRLALEALKRSQNGALCEYLDSRNLTERHVWQSKRTKELFPRLVQQQGSVDIYALPIQMGRRRRHESADRVRGQYDQSECGLGLFDATMALLVNPDWLSSREGLGIELPGDELSTDGRQKSIQTPFYIHENGELILGAGSSVYPSEYWGSATVYLGDT